MGGTRIKPTLFRLLSRLLTLRCWAWGAGLPGSPGSAQVVQGLVESLGNVLWQDLKGVQGGASEKAMAPHSSTLAWKLPWTEEPGRLRSPWGREESDTTERLHFHFSLSCIGEGNGNPIQYSCLENPRDGGAWWAVVSGVAQSRTRLKRLSSGSSTGRGLRLAAPPPSPVRGRAPAYSFWGRWVRVPEATHQPPHELLPAVVGA